MILMQHHLDLAESQMFSLDRDNITKILQDIQIKHGFLIMQLLQRLHQLKIGLID